MLCLKTVVAQMGKATQNDRLQNNRRLVTHVTRQVFVDGILLDPPLSTKQFDLIWFLYQNRGRVVSKDEIAQAVWPEMQGEVYDANIDRMISRVRNRIEPETEDVPRFVATIRGYGYRLLVE